MRISEIVKIDSKRRITLPLSFRDVIGVREGMYVMLTANTERGEISITPFADPKAKLAKFIIEISDEPGSLARAATVLAKEGADLLKSESRTLQRGRLAEWYAIADVSKVHDLEKLKEQVLKEGRVKRVSIEKLPT